MGKGLLKRSEQEPNRKPLSFSATVLNPLKIASHTMVLLYKTSVFFYAIGLKAFLFSLLGDKTTEEDEKLNKGNNLMYLI